ncbi:unnamed protein product, partial [Ectocarpus sp. 12 AP-2014]
YSSCTLHLPAPAYRAFYRSIRRGSAERFLDKGCPSARLQNFGAKPNEVVPEHRRRARVVWGALLVSMVAYMVWQSWAIHNAYDNPSTRIAVTDDRFEFPFISVCVLPGEGCDWSDGSVDKCVADALEFSTVFDHEGEEHPTLVVASQYSNCVGFDLTELDIAEVPPSELRASIEMNWLASDMASATDTEVDFIEQVAVIASTSGELPDEDEISFVYMPYDRYTTAYTDFLQETTAVDLTIGKTTKKMLDGSRTTVFPALTMTTSTAVSSNIISGSYYDEYALGYLRLNVRQGPFSLTSVEEVRWVDRPRRPRQPKCAFVSRWSLWVFLSFFG